MREASTQRGTSELRNWLPEVWGVVDRQRETADAVTLTVRPCMASHAFPVEGYPGQFNMLAAFGQPEVPISISRFGPGVMEHTIRSVGKATEALCKLDVGAELFLRGPYGRPWPGVRASSWEASFDGRDILIIAGGLGLAPVRPLIDAARASREHLGTVTILAGARCPSQHIFAGEVDEWTSSLTVLRTVDQVAETGERSARGFPWLGRVGFVTQLLAEAHFRPLRTSAYICGPEAMMRVIGRALVGLSVPDDQIFVSLERNMKCGFGVCGHCQFGSSFVCRNGPVYSFREVAEPLRIEEL